MPTLVAAKMQTASTVRNAPDRSAIRPATGTERRRIAVPRPKNIPICSGVSPRDSRKRGRNGELTPKAAYMTA
jgi:hypothetical protein